jgi:hypothetical protein
MPLLLIDYIFDENRDVHCIIGDSFIGCMRNIDKERGHHMMLNDLGYKIKFRCSPIFEIDESVFQRLMGVIANDNKLLVDLT